MIKFSDFYKFDEQKCRDDWKQFLKESDTVKEKRTEAINISSDRKLNKTENYEFNFKYYEYRLEKGEYPVHPSAKLENNFELITRTTKGSLETTFTYNCIISDYLSSSAISNVRITIGDLKEFKAFINDEEVKLDKGTAKKISNNLKINDKEIMEKFKTSFSIYKDTNFNKIKDSIEEVLKNNKDLERLQDIVDKSDEISKIVKKYKTPIQKIVYYRDILVIFDGYLNEKMRINTKKALDSFETELWSINDSKLRKRAEDTNSEVLKELSKIGSGKLVYISRKEEISQDF